MRYEGEFVLAWLHDGERVTSAGDGTGAAIIISADGSERRVNIGDEIEVRETRRRRGGVIRPRKERHASAD